MAIHFQDQRVGPAPLDDQGSVDRWHRLAVEPHVHDGASNGYDYTHRRNRIH